MGQKVNPIGLRVGIHNNAWASTWYSQKDYATLLHEDIAIRAFVKKNLAQANVNKSIIERVGKKVVINIHTAKPAVIIGKKGTDIEKLKKNLSKLCNSEVVLNIIEVRKPEIEATLIADSIAQQLEKRISFRRAMKRAMQNALKHGAKGIRVNCSGRLGGAEIARTEWYREGRVPLHTLRANIDYGTSRANTTYGVIGVKVWVYKGDSVTKESQEIKQL